MPIIHKRNNIFNPAKTILLGFLIIISVGAVLLCLPISSRTNEYTPFIDALFTATSATCVTGLVVFDTYHHWTTFGQVVILLLIEIGGIGFLTFINFFNAALGRKMKLRQINNAAADYSEDRFVSFKTLFPNIMRYVLVFQLIGVILLIPVFVPDYGTRGIFVSLFMSVSAFCNAGMDVISNGGFTSMMPYNSNHLVLLTLSFLVMCGGFGYIVWDDILHYRKTKKLLLHTKIVLLTSAILLVLATVVVFVFEFTNENTLGNLSLPDKAVNAWFTSVSARTAGFTTFQPNDMYGITKLFICINMFIGGAPGSTGGGIKVTTFAVMIMVVVSVVKSREDAQILGRTISKSTVYRALTVCLLYAGIVTVGFSVLFFTSGETSGIDSLYETISAVATVGSSAGISTIANIPSKIALIIMMFVGRIGPVSLIISLMVKGENNKNKVMPEGKIMVG